MHGDSLPMLVVNDELVVEAETPGAGNSATTATAPDIGGGRSRVRVATDTMVYVSFGEAPNATSDADRLLLPAGAVEYFDITAGWKAAVTEA
jgi:hypothetical protein